MKTKILFISIICVMLLVFPAMGFAQVKTGDNIYIPSDVEIADNFFAAGQSVDLGGHFLKDVYVWGNMVTISGKVDGDVIVAGSNVRITGDVAGDVRAAASNLELEGKVGKNATLAGGVIMVKEGAEIGWDLIMAGGLVSVNGPVKGKINVAAGNIDINSTVGESVYAKVDQQGQFVLRPKANIGGGVYYTWDKELVQEEGAVVQGEIKRDAPKYAGKGKDAKKIFTAAYWGMKLFSFAALLLVGLLIVAIWGRFSEKVVAKNREKYGKSLGIGVLVLILVPIAFFVLMITIIGIPLAFVALMIYGILLYVSKVFASQFVGNLLLKAILKKKNVDKFLAFLVGLVILSIIGLIPFLGGLVWLVVSLAAFGAFILVAYEGAKVKKAKKE